MNQNSISTLPSLSLYRYENFFNVYSDNDGNYFYNLLRNINIFPAQDSSVEDPYIIQPTDTWYYISYKYYNTVDLWWLICEYNQIKDPTKMPELGSTIKLLKSQYVSAVLSQLNLQNNS